MKHYLALFFLIFSTNSFAIFCPSNFNQINIGDPIEKIETQCGKPTSQTTSKTTANQPQEWNYYVPMSSNQTGSQTGTVRMTVAFDQGKVVNLSVNSVGVSSTDLCGPTVQIGDAQRAVESACGKPKLINTGQQSQDSQNTTEITTFTYEGPQTATLTFENGKLKSRQ